jgi:hypothetical protein
MSDAADMTVTDARGRVLQLQVVDPAQMMDLMEAAGSAADNKVWMQYALIIASVASIDGVPVPVASTKTAIRRNAVLVGHDGIAAAGKQLYGDAVPAGEDEDGERAGEDEDGERAIAKN